MEVNSMAKKKMILDLDTGIDDALAIAYALTVPEADLIGVIGSYGNVLTPQAVQNCLDLLDMLGHPEVPVFAGPTHSSTTTTFSVMPISQRIHGMNGVGDVSLPHSSRTAEQMSGRDFIIEAAHQYGDDLIVVPTDPLTTLAAAIKKDPAITHLIGNVTLMSGALTIPGNVTPATEANINQDPVAANEVFQSPLPLTMVGLDVTTRTLLTKKKTAQWRALETTAGKKYAAIVDYYIDIYADVHPHLNGCALHDPLAVAVAVDPSLVTTLPLNMKVEVDGPCAGRTIGDEELLDQPVHSQAAVNVDKDRFEQLLMTRLTTLFQNN